MRLRKLDTDYDMTFGHGSADYFRDQPDAPAQLVLSRLNLFTGDWFLQTDDGMPWRSEVLGRGTDNTRDRAIRARILATQGVTGITTYASQVNRDTRADTTQVTLTTAYDANAQAPGTATTMTDVRYGR